MAENKNRYITVAYKLYSDNEKGIHEIFEEAPEEHPFQFITGLSAALPAFEAQVAELNAGDSFDFTLSVEEAFGPYEQEHVIEVPKEMFHIDGRFDKTQIYPGAILPLVNEEGMRFEGLVLDVTDDKVKLDLNHPLAGRDLHYVGKVVTAREATPEEIQGMINMMSGEGCGCGCGCGTVRGSDVPVADRSLGEAGPTGRAWTAGWAGAGRSPIAASRWAC